MIDAAQRRRSFLVAAARLELASANLDTAELEGALAEAVEGGVFPEDIERGRRKLEAIYALQNLDAACAALDLAWIRAAIGRAAAAQVDELLPHGDGRANFIAPAEKLAAVLSACARLVAATNSREVGHGPLQELDEAIAEAEREGVEAAIV